MIACALPSLMFSLSSMYEVLESWEPENLFAVQRDMKGKLPHKRVFRQGERR